MSGYLGEDIAVEVVVIDYGGNISVSIKYAGKECLFEEIKKGFAMVMALNLQMYWASTV